MLKKKNNHNETKMQNLKGKKKSLKWDSELDTAFLHAAQAASFTETD